MVFYAYLTDIHAFKKTSKRGRRPAWSSSFELLAKFKQKMEVSSMWKKGEATWDKYSDTVTLCKDATRKAKAHLEWNLSRDIKDSTKVYFRYISRKTKIVENVDPLLIGARVLKTENTENADLLNVFFASVLTAKISKDQSLLLSKDSVFFTAN